MSFYGFPLNTSPFRQGFVQARGGALTDRIRDLQKVCDGLTLEDGEIGSGLEGEALKEYRSSQIGWVPVTVETAWIYEAVAAVAIDMNHANFGFDLSGFQPIQYTVYSHKPGDAPHYDFHTDVMAQGKHSQRKLSLVMQLSDPLDYEGGELIVWNSERFHVPKEKSLMVGFPSYSLHKVTPVTRGVRKSLVAWAVGPQFR